MSSESKSGQRLFRSFTVSMAVANSTVRFTCLKDGVSWTLPRDALHACSAACVLGQLVQGITIDKSEKYVVVTDEEVKLIATEDVALCFVKAVVSLYQDLDMSIDIPLDAGNFIRLLLSVPGKYDAHSE
jgi:hypothetical protein